MDAMDKIRDEMATSKNPGVQMIGEAMTKLLAECPELGSTIEQEGKTLQGAFDRVKAYAKKHAQSGCCFVPPQKAAEIVAEYWGIDIAMMQQAVAEAYMPAVAKMPEKPKETSAASSLMDELDLDALLGGL